jgi:DNA-binding transcriptional ArsR family regulator
MFAATLWVRDLRGVPATQRLVLYALASRVSVGAECWPSMELIAADTGLHLRTVRNVLRELEDRGLITTARGGGRKQSSIYRLAMDDAAAETRAPEPPFAPQPQRETRALVPETRAPVPETRALVPETRADGPPKKTEEQGRERKKPGGGARGARLPADWQPSPADRVYAEDRGLDPDRISQRFRNHWLAKAGRDAAKCDWHRTWQNWCDRQVEMDAKRPPAMADRRPGGAADFADRAGLLAMGRPAQ